VLVLTTFPVAGSVCYPNVNLMTQCLIHDSGNGDLTIDEAKTHFTAWALLKSPLVIVSDEHGDRCYLDLISF